MKLIWEIIWRCSLVLASVLLVVGLLYWINYVNNTVTIQLVDANGIILPSSLGLAIKIDFVGSHGAQITSGTSGLLTYKFSAIPRGTHSIIIFRARDGRVLDRLLSSNYSEDQLLYTGVIIVKETEENIIVWIPNITQKIVLEIAEPGFKIPEIDASERIIIKKYEPKS